MASRRDPKQPDAFDPDAIGADSLGADALGSDDFSADEQKVRAGFWGKLASVASRVPFAEDAAAAYYCALDRKTPTRVRAVMFGALAYFLLPTDAVPDIFLGLGFTDDAAVLATAFNMLAGHIAPAHRLAAQAALARLKAR